MAQRNLPYGPLLEVYGFLQLYGWEELQRIL